jgi:hypothetical protein
MRIVEQIIHTIYKRSHIFTQDRGATSINIFAYFLYIYFFPEKLQTMASMNYFNSSRKNLTYILKRKSAKEMHAITQFTNLHDYS